MQENENDDSEAHRRAVTVSGSVLKFRGKVEQEDKDVDDWCCREVVEAFQRAVVELALRLPELPCLRLFAKMPNAAKRTQSGHTFTSR